MTGLEQLWGIGIGVGLAAIGAALTVVGAGMGIARIASASVESIARQPEAAGDIRGAMIITAALIEGVALFAVVVCFQAGGAAGGLFKAIVEKMG